MKFLIDPQLPSGLKKLLINERFDTLHTDDLLNKERTTDNEIRKITDQENRVLITKDSDFVDPFFIKGTPKKLVFITTGNIKNKDLFTLFSKNLNQIIKLLKSYSLIEMDNKEIIVHE